MKVFKYNLKVYYEDTDFGGIVYHANYLKYFERARSELISSIGYSNKKLLDKHNVDCFYSLKIFDNSFSNLLRMTTFRNKLEASHYLLREY